MNQEFVQPKKGMSTGCLVALIIVGVLVVMVIVAGIFEYLKCNDIVGYGAVTVAQEVKRTAAADPQPGVDTVRVNQALDAFIARTQETEKPDMEVVGGFVQNVQHVLNDKIIDSLEAEQIVSAVYRAYPDLLADEAPEPDESGAADTTLPEAADTAAME